MSGRSAPSWCVGAPVHCQRPVNGDWRWSRTSLTRAGTLDAETGVELWHKNLGGAAPGNMVYDPLAQRVYVGTFTSELIAVDLKSHDVVARFETDGWLWGSPAVEGDMLYFGDLTGALYAVRITDSGFEQVWKKPVAEDGIRATPILTDGLLIVASKDHNVYAVSKEDGAGRWYRTRRAGVGRSGLCAWVRPKAKRRPVWSSSAPPAATGWWSLAAGYRRRTLGILQLARHICEKRHWPMFDIIINPFITILLFLYQILGGNVVLAIIVFTILVRLATYPLTIAAAFHQGHAGASAGAEEAPGEV